MSITRFFLAFVILLTLGGCQTEQYEKIDSKSSLIIVVNLLDNSLSFYNEATRNEVTRWEIPYTYTGALLLGDNKTLLLYGKHLEKIYLYDLTTGRQVDQWKVGKGIVNIYLAKDHSKLYLANQESDTIEVRTPTGKELSEIKVGADPLTMLESEKGEQLYILNFADPVISVIDMKSNKKVNGISAKFAAMGAALIESKGELWVGGHGAGNLVENTVSVYSLKTGEISQEIDAPIMPVDLEQFGEDVYVISHGSNQLRQIDITTKKIKAVIEIGANPFDISIMNHLIYIASYDSNEIIVVDPNRMKVIDTIKTGKGPFQILFKRGAKNE